MPKMGRGDGRLGYAKMVKCGEDFRFFLGLFSGRSSGGRVE
jgi:hypothetical protein